MSGDRERALRTGWECDVTPPAGRREEALRTISGDRPAPRRAGAGDHGADVSDHRARHAPARLPEVALLPTLVIHGTLDQMLPVRDGRMIAGLIPESSLEVLEGVGHLCFWEQPEHSAELVRAHAAVHA